MAKKVLQSSIKDYLVQNNESNDQTLHNKLLDVNIRLFASNKKYSGIILLVVDYMKKLLATSFSDYPNLKGISGANIGIPINIIGFVDSSGRVIIMINPKITNHSKTNKPVMSNCGSLNLSSPIKVERFERVTVDYCDESGKTYLKTYTGREAFTIQHEIDHNNGILITDREKTKEC